MQAKQIKIHQQSAKLGPKQLGPFEVTEVLSDVDYRLALPPVLRFSLGLLWTAYLPVMTTARITLLVMDFSSGGVITCTISDSFLGSL